MPIEETIKKRITGLIEQAQVLKRGNENDQVRTNEHMGDCTGWIVAATNQVQLLVPTSENAYRKMAEEFLTNRGGYVSHQRVEEFSKILENLMVDLDQGLISSIADQARAETFDNFLDHAKAYLKEGKAKQAGVIAGVVFEDSVRRICAKYAIMEAGRNLEDLINDLKRDNHITQTKAKRAKAAADVRTKATHAQWDKFVAGDVQATIVFTEELVANHLDN